MLCSRQQQTQLRTVIIHPMTVQLTGDAGHGVTADNVQVSVVTTYSDQQNVRTGRHSLPCLLCMEQPNRLALLAAHRDLKLQS